MHQVWRSSLMVVVAMTAFALTAGQSAPAVATPPPAIAARSPWTALVPTYSILDITSAKVRGSRRSGSAEVQITYSREAPGWTLPDQALRIVFGRFEEGQCSIGFPVQLGIRTAFPSGNYWVSWGRHWGQPRPARSVDFGARRLSESTWRYSVRSSRLKSESVSCVWVAVGDRDDWEWFVNAGAFAGFLDMR